MSSVPHAYFQNQSLGLRWLDGWMVGCLGLWNWDLKSRTESVQRLFFHFHVQPSLLWNFWTTFCVFEKQVWKSRFKCVSMCFPWNFIWFHHIHWTTAPQSPPRTPSCNTSVSSGTEVGPRSALTWFSTVEHRTISRAFSKCFFFSKKRSLRKGRKSVSSNVSRYRPITAPRYQQRPGVVQALHWLEMLFVGLMVPSPKQSSRYSIWIKMDGQDEMEWNDMKFPYVWSFCHRIFGFAFRTLISVPEQVLSRKTSILKCREDFWAKFSFAELKLLRCQEILQWQAKGGGWEYSESKSGSNSLKLENFHT